MKDFSGNNNVDQLDVLSYTTGDVPDIKYAGLWVRLLAFLVDMILIGIVFVAMCYAVVRAFQWIYRGHDINIAMFFAFIILAFLISFTMSLVLSWLYFAFSESSLRQATIGKRVFKIYVAGHHGRRLTFLGATKRYIMKSAGLVIAVIAGLFAMMPRMSSLFLCLCLLGGLCAALWLAGCLLAAMDNEKRALHDLIANTYVRAGNPNQVLLAECQTVTNETDQV